MQFTVSYTKWKQIVDDAAGLLIPYHFYNGSTHQAITVVGVGVQAVIFITSPLDPTDLAAFLSYFPAAAIVDSLDDLLADRVALDLTLGANLRRKTLYDIQDLAIYTGFAPLGASEADPVWTIKRTTLNADGAPLADQWTAPSTAVWDNRVTETYS